MLTGVPRAFLAMTTAATKTTPSRHAAGHPPAAGRSWILELSAVACRVAVTITTMLIRFSLWLAFAAACVAAGSAVGLIAFILLGLYAALIRR